MNVIEVEPLSGRKIEFKARTWLAMLDADALRGTKPVDVIEVLELLQDHLGYDLSVTNLPPNIEARVWPNKLIEISEETYRCAVSGEFRARFTLAHECAHALLHCKQIQAMIESGQKLTLNRRSSVPAFRDPEWQANTFASAFLMPLNALKLFGNRVFDPRFLSSKFGVSVPAAEVRIKNVERWRLLTE